MKLVKLFEKQTPLSDGWKINVKKKEKKNCK